METTAEPCKGRRCFLVHDDRRTKTMTGPEHIFPFGDAFESVGEAEWEALAEKALKGNALESLVSRTADDIVIEPLNVTPSGGLKGVARPVRKTTGPWKVLTRIDHNDPDAANAQALEDLNNGADGLHLVFGGAAGSFGFGPSSSVPGIFPKLLADIDPAQTALVLDMPPGSLQITDQLSQLIISSGLNAASAQVSFGLDPFFALTARDRSSRSIQMELSSTIDTAIELSERGFAGPFIRIDARPVHAAGGSEAQELAWLLGSAIAILRALEAAGVSLEKARKYLQFSVAADADQFATIAKMRALRRLWARVEDACSLTPAPIAVHAETAWRMMSVTDPWVNVLRATIATFSAIVGGADMISVLPHTQAAGLPGAEARRLARNVQLILQEESHLAKVDDPAGGAGGMEALTDAMCVKSWDLFQQMQAKDGLVEHVLSGRFGADVKTVRQNRMQQVETAGLPLTGTSAFPGLSADPLETECALEQGWMERFAPDFRPERMSEPFEALRTRAQAREISGKHATVFLANIGALATHSARTNYAMNFFAP